jgi:diacylglycerol kinase family enzyme
LSADVDVIVNRAAHGGPSLPAIAADARRAGATVHETLDLGDLARVADGIATRGARAVVLVGGDGSVMRGLSALASAYGGAPLPPVGLAGGGTMCTIARNHGMRGDRQAWAARVVHAACEGTGRRVDVPTLRVRRGADPRAGVADDDHVGFIFGTGLVARFFEAYDAAPRPGAATAASLAARVFAGSLAGSSFARHVLSPMRCRLAVDGQTHTAGAWSLVLAATVRDVGLHFLVPYRAGEDIDRFHVVASGLSAHALGVQLPRVMAGRPLQGEPRVDALARSLHVAFDEVEGAYILDGDRFQAHEVTVTDGPRVTLVVPAGP